MSSDVTSDTEAGLPGGHFRPRFSLYSTDTEEQVASVNRGLDRCGALLKSLLSPEKDDTLCAQEQENGGEQLHKSQGRALSEKLTSNVNDLERPSESSKPHSLGVPRFPGESKHKHTHPHASSTPVPQRDRHHLRSNTEPRQLNKVPPVKHTMDTNTNRQIVIPGPNDPLPVQPHRGKVVPIERQKELGKEVGKRRATKRAHRRLRTEPGRPFLVTSKYPTKLKPVVSVRTRPTVPTMSSQTTSAIVSGANTLVGIRTRPIIPVTSSQTTSVVSNASTRVKSKPLVSVSSHKQSVSTKTNKCQQKSNSETPSTSSGSQFRSHLFGFPYPPPYPYYPTLPHPYPTSMPHPHPTPWPHHNLPNGGAQGQQEDGAPPTSYCPYYPLVNGWYPVNYNMDQLQYGAEPNKDGAVPNRDGAVPNKDGAVPNKDRVGPNKDGAVPNKGAVRTNSVDVPSTTTTLPFVFDPNNPVTTTCNSPTILPTTSTSSSNPPVLSAHHSKPTTTTTPYVHPLMSSASLTKPVSAPTRHSNVGLIAVNTNTSDKASPVFPEPTTSLCNKVHPTDTKPSRHKCTLTNMDSNTPLLFNSKPATVMRLTTTASTGTTLDMVQPARAGTLSDKERQKRCSSAPLSIVVTTEGGGRGLGEALEEMERLLLEDIVNFEQTLKESGYSEQLSSHFNHMRSTLSIFCDQLRQESKQLTNSCLLSSPPLSTTHWLKQIHQLEDEKSQLLQRIIDSESAYSEVMGQLEFAKKEKNSFHSQVEAHRQELSSLRDDLQSAKVTLAHMESQNTVTKEDYRTMRHTAEAHTKLVEAENKDLKENTHYLEEELTKTKQGSLETAQEELQMIRLTIAEKDTQLLQAQDQLLGLRQCLAHVLSELKQSGSCQSCDHDHTQLGRDATCYIVSSEMVERIRLLVNDGNVDRFLSQSLKENLNPNKLHNQTTDTSFQYYSGSDSTLTEGGEGHEHSFEQQDGGTCLNSSDVSDRSTLKGVPTLSSVSNQVITPLNISGLDNTSPSLLPTHSIPNRNDRSIDTTSQSISSGSFQSMKQHFTASESRTAPKNHLQRLLLKTGSSPQASSVTGIDTQSSSVISRGMDTQSCVTTSSEVEFRKDLASLDSDIARLQIQFRVALQTNP